MKFGKGELSRLTLLFAVALIVCLVFASTAFGVVGFGNPVPAEGAVVTAPVNVSIKAADASSELKATLCNIVIKDAGGNIVVGLPAVALVDGVLKIDGASLAAGSYTACASAVDAKLKTYSKVWAFSVDSGGGSEDPCVLVAGFPVGKTYGTSADIGATFTGSAPTVASVTVNGVVYDSPTIAGDKIFVPDGVVVFSNIKYNVVVEADGDSLSFSFSVRGEFEGPDCFACHETIMTYHEFSSCDPCHGEDSPFGGGFSDSFGSPHGDATGSCINSDCHAGILDPSLNNELLTTCDGCHTGVVNEVHHARAIENPSCIGCHAYGTPEGSKTCKSCHVESLMAVHHAADDAGSMCADCHADIIAQANPVRLSLTFSNTTNNLRRALMTHLVTPATEGTGDPWLDNGDPATRGSKCVDCHNIAQTAVGDPLAGAVGYVPDYSGVGNFGEVTNFTAVELGNDTGVNSAYLCVKCHGGPASAAGTTKVLNTNITSNTTGNGNGDNFNYRRGDIAKEFNPANASGHRVFGGEVQVKFQNVVGVRGWYGAPGATGGPTVASGFQPPGIPGTNVDDPLVETTVFPELRMPIWSMTTWFKGTDSNGNPWAYNSQMTCTDCHTALASNELSGPHGANIKYGLDPNYQVDWKFSTPTNQMNITAANQVTAANNKTQIVCWKCHDLLAVYNGAHGNTHAQSNHRGRNCVACHTAIPHGSTRPRLLSEWYRDEQQYTSRQYGVAIGSASINIINLGQLNTTAINGYNDAQLISTRYGWSSGASANCTRGCNTHGSPGAAQWYWE